MKATFPPNDILFGQDFRYFKGIPSGIEFSVELSGDLIWLRAPGFGERGNYGNGRLCVKKNLVMHYIEQGDKTP